MREINLLEGKVVAPEGMKVAIVASRFNEIIVNKLLGGAVDGLVRHGVDENNITAAWVPGAFEIPLTAKKFAESGKYDAVICVGAVIRGDTTHYDYVCNEVSKVLLLWGLKQAYLYYSVLSQPKISNRLLQEPEAKQATKVMTVPFPLLKWLIFLSRCSFSVIKYKHYK